MNHSTHREPLLISMHMEKCGGTSLERLLRDEYADGFHLYDRGAALPDSEPELPVEVSCLHGHMFFGLHQQYPQRGCEYITLLRDPVARFLSNFEHICNFEHPLHTMATGDGGLEAFCAEPASRHYRNLFVRRLAGVRDEIGAADLTRAEDNLRTFAVVGLLDQVEAFITACTQRFGWSQHELQHQNRTPGQTPGIDELTPAQRQKVLAANDWDRQLMLRVEDLFVR